MKKSRHFSSTVAVLVLTLAAGCASHSHFSKRQVQQEAVRDAAAAATEGRPYICEAGTFDTHATPGVPSDKLHLLQGLPHKTLPGGCVNPEAPRNIAYAEAFNNAMIRQLSGQGK
jgi:hypothetical protein